ncbi:MAG: CDP-alcohol phosphatidyltransferase [Candidatus Hydrothermarchaeota archaeon]|nr:MAG: CDP-alcohol phosphatidyltransferase [Candidatus Hydrothermarchaeota archaeon]
MKAVILAAGLGRRMRSFKPKPLVNLFGFPIIEHTIRKLKDHEIIVVYHLKEIAEFIKRKFPNVKLIYNPNPKRENGYSLYLAKKYIDGDFLLLMADHYYAEEFFSFNDSFDKTMLFVSEKCYGDEKEATKVKVNNGRILSIGKNLKKYEYFDTGFFYCKKEIFDCIEKIKKDKIKLSDVITELSKRGEVGYKIINDFWMDIDTKKELKNAEKAIEKSLIKESDGYISRYINRKISAKITKFIARFDFVTPNMITFFSFLIGLLSAFFFFNRNPIAGGILAQVSSVIDGCDGELARIKNMGSSFGSVFDSLLDRCADLLIVLGMLFAYGFTTLSIVAFFFASSGSILVSYVWHLTKIRFYPACRDARLFMIMIGGLLSWFSKEFLLYTMLLIGALAHFGIWWKMYRFYKEISKKAHTLQG